MIFKKNKKTATSRKNMTESFKRIIQKKAFEKRQNLLIKSRLRKYNMTVRKKQIESTNNITLFQIVITINENRHTTMIDSSSKNNYVSTTLAKRKRFFIHSKNKNAFETYVIGEEFVSKMN